MCNNNKNLCQSVRPLVCSSVCITYHLYHSVFYSHHPPLFIYNDDKLNWNYKLFSQLFFDALKVMIMFKSAKNKSSKK